MSDNYTLAEVIKRDSKFSKFIEAINDADFMEKLRETGPFTVFAPTNNAFAKIPEEILSDLRKPENKEKFRGILSYHVILGKIMSQDIAKMKTAKTLQGQELKIYVNDGVKINDARLQARDVDATNGVIHSIDTVLAPLAIANNV